MASCDVCRLCGRKGGIFINIFQTTPECLAKIEAVIPDVIILRNDSLSKVVCHRCMAKVKEFFDFKVTCIQTQKEFKRALPWMSSSVVNGGKISFTRPASPTVTFMGGPIAFPYEVRDPNVEVLTLSDDEDKADTNTLPTPIARAAAGTQQHKRVPVGRVQPSSQAPQHSTSPSNRSHPSCLPGTSKVHSVTPIPPLSSKSTVGVTITPILQTSDIQPKTTPPFMNSTGSGVLSKGKMKAYPPKSEISNDKSITKDVPQALKELPTPYSMSNTTGPSTSSGKGTAEQLNHFNVAHPSMTAEINRNIMPSHSSSSINKKEDPPSSSQNSTISRHSSSGGVKNIRKTPYEKPKPKCKKQLTESDIKRICLKYSNVDPVKINEKHIIFPCKLCNKILMTEEAITTHTCVAVETNATDCTKSIGNNQIMSKGGNMLNQNEDSNDSTSSVELILSDDDNFNRQLTPKHLCNICGQQFHNYARLQKHHQISHSLTGTST